MRKLCVIFYLLVSVSVYAKTLNCSANGTDVYYINGVLTKQLKNAEDTAAIKDLIDAKRAILDSGPLVNNHPPVNYIGIHNPSFGIVNDAAEMFAQSYSAQTGKDNGKAFFNLIQIFPEVTQNPNSTSGRLLNATLGMFGLAVDALNIISLKVAAGEAIDTALAKSAASVNTLTTANENVVVSIASAITTSRVEGRKSLLIAHSQGNAALVAAVTKLTSSNRLDEIDYMKKFMGVYHVASPIAALGSSYKSRNVRSNQDHVIGIFEDVAAKLGLSDLIKPAPVTHDIVSRAPSSPDLKGHYFADTYLSSNVLVRPHWNTTAIPIAMSENFVNTLSDLATDLEDNCNIPNLKFTSSGIDEPQNGSENWIIKPSYDGSGFVKIGIKDLNDTDVIKTTRFFWSGLDTEAMLNNADTTTPIFTPEIEFNSLGENTMPSPLLSQTSDILMGYQKYRVRAVNKFGKENSVIVKVIYPNIQPDIDISVDGSIRNINDSTVFDYQPFTNYKNQISISTIDKNDNSLSTYFEFNYIHYSDSVESPKVQKGISKISDFEIPFSLTSYYLKIVAKNRFGKSAEKVFHVRVINDVPPTVSLVNHFCTLGGTTTTDFLISDVDSNSNIVESSYFIGDRAISQPTDGSGVIYRDFGPEGSQLFFSGIATSSDYVTQRVVMTIPGCN